MSSSFKPPAYRCPKPSGQAVVTVRLTDGTRRDIYLGPYRSIASHAEYARVVAELAANFGRMAAADPLASDLTGVELLARFREHPDRYYRLPDGRRRRFTTSGWPSGTSGSCTGTPRRPRSGR
jgi:hypothetical protein